MNSLTKAIGVGFSCVLAAGAVLVAGCGSPEGAGTVDMAAAKKAAAARGIATGKDADVATTNAANAGDRAKKAPAGPRPKGGR